MSRRSSRIEERRRTTGVDIYDAITRQLGVQETLDGEPQIDNDDSCSSDEDMQERRPRKRVKRDEEDVKEERPQKLRGKRGVLQKVKDMPLDVLFEIFSYLEPLDILHLARTSYELRDLLMDRASASVWRAAHCNINGLPPLPFDLDEPQYASLCFDNYCHVCTVHSSHSLPESTLRSIAVHATSLRTNFMAVSNTVLQELHQNRVRALYHPPRLLIHSSLVSASDLVGVWRTTYARTFSVFELVKDYVPYMSVTPWRGPWRGEDKVYYPPVVRKFRREFKKVEKDSIQLEAWVREKKEQYHLLMEHVEQCTQWCKSRHEERKAELDLVRRRRKEEIIKRLKDLGWSDELEHVPDAEFSSHKLVHQSKDLTEKGWKSISGPLVAYLAAHMQSRLEEEEAITAAVHPPSQN
ncbi:hypothetical protein VKT23_012129 [Stygiomarasmius scandens]|uniref:F-box domain-containing protein n=1 Tax=Marasmiellus scandens TaxID=2682957 RepID=A0ABR1J7S0_9AGAR